MLLRNQLKIVGTSLAQSPSPSPRTIRCEPRDPEVTVQSALARSTSPVRHRARHQPARRMEDATGCPLETVAPICFRHKGSPFQLATGSLPLHHHGCWRRTISSISAQGFQKNLRASCFKLMRLSRGPFCRSPASLPCFSASFRQKLPAHSFGHAVHTALSMKTAAHANSTATTGVLLVPRFQRFKHHP